MKDSKLKVVVVDTDAIIAQIKKDDKHFLRARKLSEWLYDNNYLLIYPSTTLTESVTTLHRKLNLSKLAKDLAKSFAEEDYEIVEVDKKITKLAIKNYYLKTKSKKNTLFDCIVAASAKNKKAAAIFSFDDFYRQVGFKLVEDLVD